MPLSATQAESLFEALTARGWTWDGETIFAPHRTIWLGRRVPWEGDLLDFLERMEARLVRISAGRFGAYEQALVDTTLLVDALKIVAAQPSTSDKPRGKQPPA